TSLGPAFVAVIVYVTLLPGTADVTPSVFVIWSSACGVIVSVSVAVLFARLESVVPPGAVTVAVLLRVPVADGATVPLTMCVIVLPAGIVTVSAMFPAPEAVNPVAPPVGVAV